MIAIFVNSLIGGGAERVSLTLLEEFKQKGYEVMLIVLEKEAKYAPPQGVKIVYLTQFEKLSNPFIKLFWVVISAYRLSKVIKQHKISFVQSHLIRANFINVAARYFGAKHYAQIITHGQMHFKGASIIQKWKKRFYSWLYNKADEIISISEMMKMKMGDALNLHHLNGKFRVIYNPHNLSAIREMANLSADAFRFKPEKKYIISAGRIYKGKRVDDIIRAIAEVRKLRKDVELIVLGKGIGLPTLQALVKELDIEEYVHFLGHMENPFAYIARADLFVLASQSEGLPNIIIESLACGTPVISSDCISGPREILSPESNFQFQLKDKMECAEFGVLFPVGAVSLLAEAIHQLLEEDTLRLQYIQKAYQRAEMFDKSEIVDLYFTKFENRTALSEPSKHEFHEN